MQNIVTKHCNNAMTVEPLERDFREGYYYKNFNLGAHSYFLIQVNEKQDVFRNWRQFLNKL